jgi:hypothetical protein
VRYFPFNDASGVNALQKAVSTTSADRIVVFGYSEGATAVAKWLMQHINDPDIPSPDVMSFLLIGNPTRAFGGIATPNGVIWPQSNYEVLDIARQYDGVADFPTNTESPYYWLAAVNATVGSLIGHLHNYSKVDINDPANAVWTSADVGEPGDITYVLTPTKNVPILGVAAFFLPSLNARLKANIETAYIRPVPFPTITPPASSPTPSPSTSVVSDPTVAPEQTTVPLSLTPTTAIAATDPAPTATEARKTRRLGMGTAALADAVTPIFPRATQPRLNRAGAATRSTTTATKNTTAASSTDGATANPDDPSSVFHGNNKKASGTQAK